MPETPTLEDNASLRTIVRSVTELSFTTLMWALWIYLFMPLLSLVLWLVGLPILYQTLFTEKVLYELLALLERMGWVVLIIFLLLRGWGLYNYHVFGKRNRRTQSAEVTLEELGLHFRITPDDVRILQQSKEISWVKSYDDMRFDA
jgi:biofilm PGA synthesis protein PgaD